MLAENQRESNNAAFDLNNQNIGNFLEDSSADAPRRLTCVFSLKSTAALSDTQGGSSMTPYKQSGKVVSSKIRIITELVTKVSAKLLSLQALYAGLQARHAETHVNLETSRPTQPTNT